jgi:hypothetical protein
VLALFAGVASEGVSQSDYLSQRSQDVTTRPIAAHQAQSPIVAAGWQSTGFADGADGGVRSGSQSRSFHYVSFPYRH